MDTEGTIKKENKLKERGVMIGKIILAFVGASLILAITTYFLTFFGFLVLGGVAVMLWFTFCLGPTLLFIYFLWLRLGRRWYITVSGLLGVAMLAGLLLLASLNSGPHPHNRDTRRISDIKQLQLALEIYFDKDGKGGYPPLSETCQDISLLQQYLLPTYILAIPKDRLVTSGHPNYQIAISSDRKSYILRAVLEDKKYPALGYNDIDGQVFGCDCDDPSYCVNP